MQFGPFLPLSILAALTLAGCDTVGMWPIKGLVSAPMHLNGSIKNDRYTAPEGYFSVAVPFKAGSESRDSMQVKETKDENQAYVSFGLASKLFFRASATRRLTTMNFDFDALAPKVIDGFKAEIQSAYQAPLIEKESRQETINGKRAFAYILTQEVPPGVLEQSSVALTHYVYVVRLESGVAVLSLQAPALWKNQGPANEQKYREFERKYWESLITEVHDFAASVEMPLSSSL